MDEVRGASEADAALSAAAPTRRELGHETRGEPSGEQPGVQIHGLGAGHPQHRRQADAEGGAGNTPRTRAAEVGGTVAGGSGATSYW